MDDQKNLLKALGPLAALYEKPEISEVMVDAPDKVIVDRKGKLEDSGVKFDSPSALLKVIEDLLALDGEQLAPGKTIYDIRIPGRSARALAVLPPTAMEGPCLVIRKLVSTKITWDMLLEWESITQEAFELIKSAIDAPANMLITGGPGAGKITFLNRVAELIPAQERLVIAEVSHELQISHPRAVYLEAGGPEKLSLVDVLIAATKMRPDRIVIGELHGPEALTALEIFANGHTGLTAVHATSPEDALARLEAMCLMGNPGLGLEEIRHLIASALQLITCQAKLGENTRKITQIVELQGVEDGRYHLVPLFRFDAASKRLVATGTKPSWE